MVMSTTKDRHPKLKNETRCWNTSVITFLTSNGYKKSDLDPWHIHKVLKIQGSISIFLIFTSIIWYKFLIMSTN